ncbi:hypothetical protein LTR37_013218 [Vermiconidia calcicola]|uniref:Uncharacterized protein n=1 Tax=Vermiconidia calcicola TaxID=1690605 RepID=A0ACC3MX15_9PEZI|nr:hypothetical protein LTR37_013218 [Vermiconidia calcicola]
MPDHNAAALQSASQPPLPTLPPELLRDIIDAIYGTCTLRRHIVKKLRKQRLIRYKLEHSVTHYHNSSDSHDRRIRRRALPLMNKRETAAYLETGKSAMAIYNTSKTFRTWLVLAERDWLRKPPMNLKAFRDFCASGGQVHEAREEIVIELFSQDDFLHPPPEVCEGLPVRKPLKPHHIAMLRPVKDGYPGDPQSDAQELMCCALIDLWICEARRLPETVRSVIMIHRSQLFELTQVFQNMHGRDVFGGLLM